MRSIIFLLVLVTISCKTESQTNKYTIIMLLDSVLENYHYIEIKEDSNVYQAICRLDLISLDSLIVGEEYKIELKPHDFIEDIDSLTPYEKVNLHYIDNKLIFKLEDVVVIKSIKSVE
jgi:hypothetical protein